LDALCTTLCNTPPAERQFIGHRLLARILSGAPSPQPFRPSGPIHTIPGAWAVFGLPFVVAGCRFSGQFSLAGKPLPSVFKMGHKIVDNLARSADPQSTAERCRAAGVAFRQGAGPGGLKT